LWRARFSPPLEIRELREVVRYRQTVVREPTAGAKRSTQLIASANLKLGPVASEGCGRRGRLRLRALAAGATNAEKLAERAQGK
jgi:transposase